MKMDSEGESAAKKIVYGKSTKNECNCEDEKLREPDNEDGFDGDVHGSFTAYVFKYVEPMALNDIIYQDTLQLEQLRTSKEGNIRRAMKTMGRRKHMMASKIMRFFRSCAS